MYDIRGQRNGLPTPTGSGRGGALCGWAFGIQRWRQDMQTFARRGSDDERVLESAPRREGHSLPKGTGIAVLIPCLNEAATIATVVRSFKAAVPVADVYVYDNNSTDQTIGLAEAAGATVRREPLQGKGNVVRRMFADVEADVYVMVDGDSTYDP